MSEYTSSLIDASSVIVTVNGTITPEEAGITDAHNHVWIAPVLPAGGGQPLLWNQSAIVAELRDYRRVGGGTLIDCQPGGCGRDGRVLCTLSHDSGVHIVACTGFHLRKYYPPDFWLLQASSEEMATYFIREITQGLEETQMMPTPVRAGFIKIACSESLTPSICALIEAAGEASNQTGTTIQVHTEKGQAAEDIVSLFLRLHVRPERLVLCHMDKRPDPVFQRELALLGVLLEYDTFYRPKYQPDQHVWPLLEYMITEGLAPSLALATDMAEASMWSRFGGSPGLTAFITQIIPRLRAIGCDAATLKCLVGGNIASRLARDVPRIISHEEKEASF